ncbi:MAG: VWA domain-containing protein [Candidatus Binatus sp.]|uniref:vWA domain-containing protein n=1 Tax=Candidatus Binatus sp. TaxID=2811406 RepID=UPI003BAFE9E0
MAETANNLYDALTPADSAVDAASRQFADRLFEFCRLLKDAGLNVTPGRIIDVFRALAFIHLERREEFRLALRANLAASREEEEIFERYFRAYWDQEVSVEKQQAPTELEADPEDPGQDYPETPPDTAGSPRQFSRDEVLRDKKLIAIWPGQSLDLAAILREMQRRLATRPSRRRVPSQSGHRVDLRRSLRKNIKYGAEILQLARTRRKIRKTRLALLFDVSGSMDTHGGFLLQLMLGLQKGFKNSRTAVFSTCVTEITRALRQHSLDRTLDEVAAVARHWSGGTDIGAALGRFNRELLMAGSASNTVGIIVSDGYDQGDSAVIRREMQAVRRRTRTIVWINPLLGTEGYAPITAGMKAALPYVDYFLPAHDFPSLRALCKVLGEV